VVSIGRSRYIWIRVEIYPREYASGGEKELIKFLPVYFYN